MQQEIELKKTYLQLDSENDLTAQQQSLLNEAKVALQGSYAPYSNFNVGAAVLLDNGLMIKGSNQENASYPVGICAERVTLSAASAQHPQQKIISIAITVKAKHFLTSSPVSPCGICRQTLLEYEHRYQYPIEIILKGEEGKIWIIKSVKDIMPLYFDGDDINSKNLK